MPTYGTLKIEDVTVSDHRLGVPYSGASNQSTNLAAVEAAAVAGATGSSRVYVVLKRVVLGAVFWIPLHVAKNGVLLDLGTD